MTKLTVFNPWSLIPNIFDDDASSSFPSVSFAGFPPLDMYEEDDNVIVKLNVPGYSEKDIEISVTGDSLKVTGKVKEEAEKKDKRRYYMMEIKEKSFTRTITLPTNVISDKAKAHFENGVLVITLPKSEESKPKTIAIETKKE